MIIVLPHFVKIRARIYDNNVQILKFLQNRKIFNPLDTYAWMMSVIGCRSGITSGDETVRPMSAIMAKIHYPRMACIMYCTYIHTLITGHKMGLFEGQRKPW